MTANDPSSKSWLDKLIQTFFGGADVDDHEKLIEFLETAQEKKLLTAETLLMIKGTLEVAKQTVKDVMIPRSQMVVIEEAKPLPEMLSTIIESGHSRFPVIGEHKDEIKGLLLAKDLLKHYVNHEDEAFNLSDCIRSIEVVPESKRLDNLLKEFRDKHNHLALVVNEYGNLSGLVTIEDVLELIVGDIEDEYDLEEDNENQIIQEGEDTYLVDALTAIEDFNEHFGSDLSDEEYDTIGGIITSQFGHLPKIGEATKLSRFTFTVTKADKRRIRQLRVTSR